MTLPRSPMTGDSRPASRTLTRTGGALLAALVAACCAPSLLAQFRGGDFQGNNGVGGWGFGGLGGLGRRGFVPRQAQPTTSYVEYANRMAGRSPRIAGAAGGIPLIEIPKRSIDPLLAELGIEDKPKPRRRDDLDPTLRRWPTWVDVGGPGERLDQGTTTSEDRPQASECYFVRLSDRVEIQPSGEKGYFPLEFWDSARRLGIGSRCRLSGRGRALLLFSGGTEVDLAGVGECVFSQGTVDRLVLRMLSVTRAVVDVGKRGVEFRLPDASVLRATRGSFTIEREVHEIGALGPDGAPRLSERLHITNWGPDSLRIEVARGLGLGSETVEVPLRRSAILALADAGAGDTPIVDLPKTLPGGGIDLRAGVHATIRKDERGLQVEARSGDAPLHWGGTILRVPVGTSLRIDPLLGDPFQEGAGR